MSVFDRAPALTGSDAAAAALRVLLQDRLVGRIHGGRAADAEVRLRAVLDGFPTAHDGFDPPCASVTEMNSTQEGIGTELIEEHYDDDLEQALELDSVHGEFAVDLWGRNPEQRKALKAALPVVFREPGDAEEPDQGGRSGCSVLVFAPDEAVPPAWRGKVRLTVRLTLVDLPRDIDESIAAMRDEWRAQARIRWDADIVSATSFARMDVLTQSGEVAADSDTEA